MTSSYDETRSRTVDATPAQLWQVVEGLGGAAGWHAHPLLWAVRGGLDRLVGGVGVRRGRRDPERLVAGDPEPAVLRGRHAAPGARRGRSLTVL